ncbi:MAG: HD domain-containing phosphohydrolase [Pseudomonadota bacterium]
MLNNPREVPGLVATIDTANTPSQTRLWVFVGLLVGLVLSAIAIVFVYSAKTTDRDLALAHATLARSADARATALSGVINASARAVQRLATNPSIALYASLLQSETETEDTKAAAAAYLQNALSLAAEQQGFLGSESSGVRGANIGRTVTGGLVLLAANGSPLLGIGGWGIGGWGNGPSQAGIAPSVTELLPRALLGSEPLILSGIGEWGPKLGVPQSAPAMILLAPVAAVQSDPGASPSAYLLVVQDMKPRFSEDLARGPIFAGEREDTRWALLEPSNNPAPEAVAYLYTDRDWLDVGTRRAASDAPAAAQVLSTPGTIIDARGALGSRVFATGRRIAGTPWTLMETREADAVLAPIRKSRRLLLISVISAILAAAASIILAWRHGSSMKLAALANQTHMLATQQSALASLLRTTIDAQPTVIFALSGNGEVVFANEGAARLAGISREDCTGKDLHALLGATLAEPLLTVLGDAENRGLPSGEDIELIIKGQPRQGRVDARILDEATDAFAILTWHDLSETVAAESNYRAVQEELVQLLIALIDARDPFAAKHSAALHFLVEEAADAMALAEPMADAVSQAAWLLNAGKLLTPRSLLTRASALSDAEQDLVRQNLKKVITLIEKVPFSRPVAPLLRLAIDPDTDLSMETENFDQQAIRRGAALLRLSNQFVSMISPRAFRAAMTIERALEMVAEEEKTNGCTTEIMTALAFVVDHRGGRPYLEEWRSDREGFVELVS